jgi:hypothetical protein
MGHDIGARAGVAFAILAGQTLTAETGALEATDEPETSTESGETSPGTIAGEGWLSQVEVRALVAEYFKSEDVNKAVRVAWCESRFDPASTNLRTGAIGLFQHLPRYWEERAEQAGFAGADPTNPEASTAAAAWAIYEGGGWDTFACRG